MKPKDINLKDLNLKEKSTTFQIPKFEAAAEIFFADNSCRKGNIFLSILPASVLGHTSVIDSLNESAHFFPFLSEQSKSIEILSKHNIVQVIVNYQFNHDDITDMLQEVPWIEQIEVNCHPFFSIVGTVVINLPSGQSRVLDLLNQPTSFFAVKNGDNSHIINKKFVTGIKELPLVTTVALKKVAKKPGRKAKKTE